MKDNDTLTDEENLQLHLSSYAKDLSSKIAKMLDEESTIEKLKKLETILTRDDEESKVKTSMGLQILSNKDSMNDLFQSGSEDLERSRQIFGQTCKIVNKSVQHRIEFALTAKTFQPSFESKYSESAAIFVRFYCQELMVAYSNQLLELLETEGSEDSEDVSKEEKLKVKRFLDAIERRKVLDELLFQTFIDVSEHFQQQMNLLLQKMYEVDFESWSEDELKNFYRFLESVFSNENHVLRSILKYCLMFNNFEVDITWLDEIAEGIKNVATVLSNYQTIHQNMPPKVKKIFKGNDAFTKLITDSMRQIMYTIGRISHRLITTHNENETKNTKALANLNILQGGIENRFIPSLTPEAKKQIEGSFKITNDQELLDYALKNENQVQNSSEDNLLISIATSSRTEDDNSMVIDVLQ